MTDTYNGKTAKEWFDAAMDLAKTLDEERRATYEHQQRYKEGLTDWFAFRTGTGGVFRETTDFDHLSKIHEFYDADIVTRKCGKWSVVKKATEEDL